MALSEDLNNTSKFRGCLLGSLLGDCLGYVYEDRSRPIPFELQKFFDEMECSSHEAPLLPYTDDTAMTNCIAKTLIKKGDLDVRDIAERFVEEYFNDPNRYYGGHVVGVFAKLRANKCRDPVGPAREQFNGAGSFGNGGAMRISPVALFYQGQGTDTLGSMAQRVTEITHTHPNGINGAILQCLAIEQCLMMNPDQPVDASAFLKELIAKMQKFEGGSRDEVSGSNEETQPFTKRLLWALELLGKEKSGSKKINDNEDVLARLGSGISALTSVPTAIFCFLRAHQGDIPIIKTNNPLRRTLQYAISLGGDTDTIGAMAGALSGALLGYRPEYFNETVVKRCEGHDMELRIADELQRKVSKR